MVQGSSIVDYFPTAARQEVFYSLQNAHQSWILVPNLYYKASSISMMGGFDVAELCILVSNLLVWKSSTKPRDER